MWVFHKAGNGLYKPCFALAINSVFLPTCLMLSFSLNPVELGLTTQTIVSSCASLFLHSCLFGYLTNYLRQYWCSLENSESIEEKDFFFPQDIRKASCNYNWMVLANNWENVSSKCGDHSLSPTWYFCMTEWRVRKSTIFGHHKQYPNISCCWKMALEGVSKPDKTFTTPF